MAKPVKAATLATQQPVAAWWHPTQEDLEAAGFKPSPPGFSWFDATTGVMLWLYLLPKSGELFIRNDKTLPPDPKKYGHQAWAIVPSLTSVGNRAEFGALIKRYGWKHKTQPKRQPPPQSQEPPLQQAA